MRNPIVSGVWAGICAGIVSAAGQFLLWSVFSAESPWLLLLRDARLTAAIVLGPEVIRGSPGFDSVVFVIATAIHFSLSIAYGIAFAYAARWTRRIWILGILFGAAIYVVNLHGFVMIFPWFTAARDWIAFGAHLVFGAGLAGAYALESRRS